jgi:hypothetical protein
MRTPVFVVTGKTRLLSTNFRGSATRGSYREHRVPHTRSRSSLGTQRVKSISSVARGSPHAESANPPINMYGIEAAFSSSMVRASADSRLALALIEGIEKG